MTPSVESNTKYRCTGCGSIVNFDSPAMVRDCVRCGAVDWEAIPVVFCCDFCSVAVEGETVWTYPAKNFEKPSVPTMPAQFSVGGWCACHVCHIFIGRDDWNGLVLRVMKRQAESIYGGMSEWERQAISAYLFELYARFREHRTGEPYEEDLRA